MTASPVSVFDGLFDAPVRTAEMDPRDACAELLAVAERGQIDAVSPKRWQEYAAGRILARSLYPAFGVPSDFALLSGADRVPVWPAGLVGSVTHADAWAAVAVARAAEVLTVGCDLEEDEAMEETLWPRVCVAAEKAWLADRPERARLARLLFSAKECAYKAQYPLTHTFLDFHDLEIHADLEAGRFAAVFRIAVGPFVAGTALDGRFRIAHGWIATAITIAAS